MKKLYFVRTNGYDMLVSDNGEFRRVLTDNNDVLLCDVYEKYREEFEMHTDEPSTS